MTKKPKVKTKTVEVSISFPGVAGCPMDLAAQKIFEAHGADLVGVGTFLPCDEAPLGERDMQYDVAADQLANVRSALKGAGIHNVEVT